MLDRPPKKPIARRRVALRLVLAAGLVAYSALVGLAAALACSVKVTGLPLLAIVYVPVWLYVTLLSWPGPRVFLLGPAVFGVSSVVPVYVLNPFL